MADEIPDEMVIPLRKPIVHATITYSEIKLREPTAGELKLWDKLNGAEADIMAISTVGAVPKGVVEQMGARDLLVGSRYLARFLG